MYSLYLSLCLLFKINADRCKWTRVRGLSLPVREALRLEKLGWRRKNTVMVKEDLFHRIILEYGLVTGTRTQNPARFFFKKYGSKKVKDVLGDDNLLLSTHTIWMLCYEHEDKRRVQEATVKFGKDNSPSSLMDHMYIQWSCTHQQQETILTDFTAHWQHPRQGVVWHLHSCSLHTWITTFSFERLGLIESFRRSWVRCKSSFYWDLELRHKMKS